MDRNTGIEWVRSELQKPQVSLPVKIRGGGYYSKPITIYNRDLKEYGELITAAGFKVPIDTYDDETKKKIGHTEIPFWELDDYFVSMELISRNRRVLLSFTFGFFKSFG
ncbi:MAG: hypothetical protein UW02_C0003G0001, partial [Candidatus Nomurabacteria bacterium GW2011_GWB1_43_7]